MSGAYLKINGLHAGEPCNATGVGDMIRRVTNGGVPMVAKAVMGTATLMDMQAQIKAGRPGYAIWRMDRFRDGSDDVPRYGSDVEAEADRFWDEAKAVMPPELDRSIVWVELINEPDRNEWNWLGRLCTAIGQRAIRDGMRVCLLGANSGEPEPSAWSKPGMVGFLRLCGMFPDNVAISLHEYSFDDCMRDEKGNLIGNGYLVGRFRFLLKTCDSLGIPHPTIFISEWGWHYNRIPPDAIPQIVDIGALYAAYPAVKGVAAWALDVGANWGNIAAQWQAIMPQLEQALLTVRYDAPVPPPPPPPDGKHKAIVVKLGQEATLEDGIGAFVYSFEKRHTFTQSLDDCLTVLMAGNPQSYAKILSPSLPSQRETIAALEAAGIRWEVLHIDPEPEPPPPPPPIGGIDLLPYLAGDGVLYEVKNEWGSQERFQTQWHGRDFWQTKNSQAECLWTADNFIWRDWDTSPGGGRFYRQMQGGLFGARWLPRYMSVGQEYTVSLFVQFYNADCQPVAENSGAVTDTRRLVARHSTWTSRAGITLSDVVELLWVNGGERYFYARGFGLVGWERTHSDPNTPAWSAISEIHAPGQRPDNVVILPGCL